MVVRGGRGPLPAGRLRHGHGVVGEVRLRQRAPVAGAGAGTGETKILIPATTVTARDGCVAASVMTAAGAQLNQGAIGYAILV